MSAPAGLTPAEAAALLAELEADDRRAEREGADRWEAMRRLAGCTCADGRHVEVLDVQASGGVVTYAACSRCREGRQRPGAVRENLDQRRRAIRRERFLSRGVQPPATARDRRTTPRRAPSSGRPRGRRTRRAGPSRGPDDGPGSDGPGDAGPPPEAAP